MFLFKIQENLNKVILKNSSNSYFVSSTFKIFNLGRKKKSQKLKNLEIKKHNTNLEKMSQEKKSHLKNKSKKILSLV